MIDTAVFIPTRSTLDKRLSEPRPKKQPLPCPLLHYLTSVTQNEIDDLEWQLNFNSQQKPAVQKQSMTGLLRTLFNNAQRGEEKKQRAKSLPAQKRQEVRKLNSRKAYIAEEWVVILQHSLAQKHNPRTGNMLRLTRGHLSEERLQESVIGGLPSDLRGEIWKFICQAQLNGDSELYAKFQQNCSEQCLVKIQNDCRRSKKWCADFQLPIDTKKNRLANVLRAYAGFDPRVGYAQGLNFIAAILLTQIPSEIDAFWCLVYLMHDLDWASIYDQDSSRVQQHLNDLSGWLQKAHPKLADKFTYSLEAAFASQLITMCVYDAPSLEVATRIVDYVMLGGVQAVLDLIAAQIDAQAQTLLLMDESELVEYCRKDLSRATGLSDLLRRAPRVQMTL